MAGLNVYDPTVIQLAGDLSGTPALPTVPSKAPLASPTFTGTVTVPGESVTGAAGTNRSIFVQTAGISRWELVGANGAETGSDAGTDFAINSYTDAGAYKATPFYIHRDTGNIDLNAAVTISNKLTITTGSNKSAGTGTLVAGAATISTTAVTANSLIFLTDTTASLTNVGVLSVTSKSAGTSFTVTSANVLDTATFNWLIIN